MINNRFLGLDAFRGLCAVFVVIYHMHLTDSITELDFFRGSWIFVEFFFVLSGFVLTFSLCSKSSIRFGSYVISRFFRIYPLHFAMFVVFFSFQILKLVLLYQFSISTENPPFSGKNALNEVLPNILLLQSWTSFTSHSFNYPSWSISIEFYLYFLLFGVIFLFDKIKIFLFPILFLVFWLLFLSGSDFFVESVLRGFSSFFAGCCTYLVFSKLGRNVNISPVLATIIEITLIASTFVFVSTRMDHSMVVAPLLFSIVVFFFAFEFGFFSRILKHSIFQKLGTLSYSIYMTHAAYIYILGVVTVLLEKKGYGVSHTLNEGINYLDYGNASTNNFVIL
ncbi:acyltransferase family protein, partial [Vibrio splendidus]